MSWVKDAITLLQSGNIARVRPQGGSMRGRIESGQLVTIAPVTPDAVKRDDVVFIRWICAIDRGTTSSATAD